MDRLIAIAAIEAKAAQMGFGERTSEYGLSEDGRAFIGHFAGGVVYYFDGLGAVELHGSIRDRYFEIGERKSPLGWPVTNETAIADGGRLNYFEHGAIVWHPTTGAWELYDPMLDKWERLRAERGVLGFPSSAPESNNGFDRTQTFQGGSLRWSPQAGCEFFPSGRVVEKKVLVILIDFSDVPPPSGHTREWYSRLFFDPDGAVQTPERVPIRYNAYQYFARMSSGRTHITGEVRDWVHNPARVVDQMHWNGQSPEVWRSGTFINAVVPFSLRQLGIRERPDFDAIAFLHTDVWTGGAKRTMDDVYSAMRDNGTLAAEWDSAWDHWRDMPILFMGATQADPPPPANPDGTIQELSPGTTFRFGSNSILMHELGHLLFDYPDLYAAEFQFWNDSELMSTFAWDQSPPILSSFPRETSGWFLIEDMPRRSATQFRFRNVESDRFAYRFPNGPIDNHEFLVLEHRTEDAATSSILARHEDWKARVVTATPNREAQRCLTRPLHRYWGRSDTRTLGEGILHENTYNQSGELWWRFRNINASERFAVSDIDYAPIDFTAATPMWFNSTRRQFIASNAPGDPDGFANCHAFTPELGRFGPRYRNTWHIKGASREGSTDVVGFQFAVVPESGARMYLTVAVPQPLREALVHVGVQIPQPVILDGVEISQEFGPLQPLASFQMRGVSPVKTMVVDVSNLRNQNVRFELRFETEDYLRNEFYLLEWLLVPTVPRTVNLLAAAPRAVWSTATAKLTFGNLDATPQVGFVTSGSAELNDHRIYCGRVLRVAGREVSGAFPVTLNAPILRFECGWSSSASLANLPASVSVQFEDESGRRQSLMDLHRGHSEVRAWRYAWWLPPLVGGHNPLTSFMIPIPPALQGASGRLILNITADSPAELFFPMMCLTRG